MDVGVARGVEAERCLAVAGREFAGLLEAAKTLERERGQFVEAQAG
jgi:hypothetical protein